MLFRTPVMLLIFFFVKSPYLHVVNVKFWPYYPNDPQQKLRSSGKHFLNHILSKNIALVSYLTQVAPGIIFCYCNTFASRFDMFFIQKCSSVISIVMSCYLSFLSAWTNLANLFLQQLIYTYRIAGIFFF